MWILSKYRRFFASRAAFTVWLGATSPSALADPVSLTPDIAGIQTGMECLKAVDIARRRGGTQIIDGIQSVGTAENRWVKIRVYISNKTGASRGDNEHTFVVACVDIGKESKVAIVHRGLTFGDQGAVFTEIKRELVTKYGLMTSYFLSSYKNIETYGQFFKYDATPLFDNKDCAMPFQSGVGMDVRNILGYTYRASDCGQVLFIAITFLDEPPKTQRRVAEIRTAIVDFGLIRKAIDGSGTNGSEHGNRYK